MRGDSVKLLALLLLSASCWAQAPDGPKPQRIFDAEYFAHMGVLAGGISADALTSARAGNGCVEINRQLGPHPSNQAYAKHAAIEFGIALGFETAFKYLVKDSHSKWRHLIYAPSDGLAIWHGHAAYENARLC